MATDTEYALMAGRVYQSTRAQINWLPDLQSLGWTEFFPKQKSSGFEALSFQKGNEVVISFAGTGSNVDWWANAGGFFGVTSEQLRQSVDYYLQVKAANPNATISFTGHSLGGGLASLLAVFFAETAVTFDQAPFRNSASTFVANDLIRFLSDPARGYSTPALTQALATTLQGLNSFIDAAANGSIPNEGKVRDFSVQGEILSTAAVLRIGTSANLTCLTHGTADLALAVDLHAQALLTAFLLSDQGAPAKPSLRDVTFKLPDVVRMIFDAKLYYNDPNIKDNPKENFLERLVRHQIGVAGLNEGEKPIASDAMVTRFTSDMWKLAQDGGLTLSDGNPINIEAGEYRTNNVSKTLMAIAMQKYYEETAASPGYNKELFTDLFKAGIGSNGVRFNMADVSKKFADAFDGHQALNLSDAKGFDLYFKNYLSTAGVFSAEERQMITSLLPYMRDWYVQAGDAGMNATDTFNYGAFMLGGNGADSLTGGTAADLLVGNTGADTLKGGKGNDILLGGDGNDTYQYTTGDGFDIVLDAGGQGSIVVDGATLNGGAEYGDNRVHRDSDGHLYVNVGQGLVVDGDMLVQGYQDGQLGLTLSGPAAVLPDPATTSTLYGDPLIRTATIAAGGAGSDWVVVNSYNEVYSADGNTLISSTVDYFVVDANRNPTEGGGPERVDNIVGTSASERILTGARNDTISAAGGDDVIDAGAGRDSVGGGAGNDVILGGSGADVLYGDTGNDQLFADQRVTIAQAIANGNADAGVNSQGDWLGGGAGNDTLVGSAASDVLVGGGGADLLIGGAGDDYLNKDAVNQERHSNSRTGADSKPKMAGKARQCLRLTVLSNQNATKKRWVSTDAANELHYARAA